MLKKTLLITISVIATFVLATIITINRLDFNRMILDESKKISAETPLDIELVAPHFTPFHKVEIGGLKIKDDSGHLEYLFLKDLSLEFDPRELFHQNFNGSYNFNAYEGSVSGELRLPLEHPENLKGQTKLSGLNIGNYPLIKTILGVVVTGIVNGDIDIVSFNPHSPEKSGLNGRITLTRGEVEGIQLFKINFPTIHINQADCNFKTDSGIVTIDNFNIDSEEFSGRTSGTIEPVLANIEQTRFDLDIKLKVAPKMEEEYANYLMMVSSFKDDEGFFPLKATGTLAVPQITLSP